MDKDHAKTIPISEILDKLNYRPHWINHTKALYQSPLQSGRSLSFWVYLKTNRWYDYSLGIGGDLTNLAQYYLKFTNENHTLVDANRWITNLSSQRLIKAIPQSSDLIGDLASLQLKSQKPIGYVGLIHYLDQLRIPLSIARRHLQEIQVQNLVSRRSFLALGFKNEQNGFALKNPFFSGFVGPRAISFVRAQTCLPKAIHIFQTCLDYLAVLGQLSDRGLQADVIIVHEISLLPQVTAYLQDYGYRTLYSWLTSNPIGEQARHALTQFCQSQDRLRHVPMTDVFAPHEQVIDWHRQTWHRLD
ncbi:hypothetical protein [Larkinella rosea]|uniref:Zinc finger CHC2-type domain-containing protein n=1 Tax=Larkinella rosea TaxID=2025312 RepID=A0A3P1BC79_9BACT|nr:hypothetical protein [Larkinella rosea]RRA98638.1 hypothetical protein EHT25_26920 [Larkinella rosea]